LRKGKSYLLIYTLPNISGQTLGIFLQKNCQFSKSSVASSVQHNTVPKKFHFTFGLLVY